MRQKQSLYKPGFGAYNPTLGEWDGVGGAPGMRNQLRGSRNGAQLVVGLSKV